MKLFKTEDKLLKKARKQADKIEELKPVFSAMSDAELRAICHKYAPELSPDK